MAFLDVLAYGLVLAPLVNIYFVVDSIRLYRSDPEHSSLLFAFLLVKIVVWFTGLMFSIFAYRYIREIEPVFPLGGVDLALALVTINLLPGAIHLVVRSYEKH